MKAHMEMASIDVRPLSRFLKAIGDETRLRIVALLSHGELCVCHLESALGATQTKASRHLAVLRAAGVVDHERRGTWVYYRLAEQTEPGHKLLMGSVLSAFPNRNLLLRDVERLLKTRRPGACK